MSSSSRRHILSAATAGGLAVPVALLWQRVWRALRGPLRRATEPRRIRVRVTNGWRGKIPVNLPQPPLTAAILAR